MAKRAVVSGTAASLASTLVASWFSKRQSGSASGASNATSHWLWGEDAKRRDQPSLRHTAVGYGIHHASSLFWATFHELATTNVRRPSGIAAASAATAAIAYVVDYHVVPRRLTPGFENRLSPGAIAATYAAFAIGLGAAGWAYRRLNRHQVPPEPPTRP